MPVGRRGRSTDSIHFVAWSTEFIKVFVEKNLNKSYNRLKANISYSY